MRRLNVTVLGSTGSIGVNTLDVIQRHADKYRVFALTAHTNVDVLFQQCMSFVPQFAVVSSIAHGRLLEEKVNSAGLKTRVLIGADALSMVASHEETDAVMAAIVGAAGLASCIAAALAGKRLLLANKEALVVGGSIFMRAVHQGHCTLLPIDSEHSAIFQSLPSDRSVWSRAIDTLILTASGGPFRTRDPSTLHLVSPEEACAHPNWAMGRKISVDSATMMNKALEVIEAHYLFDVPENKIKVVIHPQSVIHSMVQMVDNSVLAQLGTADMRGPIAYGLSWPERIESGANPIDFYQLAGLSFENIDEGDHAIRFPCLRLARSVLNAQSGLGVVLNAANEIAVAAFLAKRIRFDQIYDINAACMDTHSFVNPDTLVDLIALDKEVRIRATQLIDKCQC